MSSLEDNDLKNLIEKLATAINNSPSTDEEENRTLFEQAIWTVQNIDQVVNSTIEYKGFLPSESKLVGYKIQVLNSVANEVATVWETIEDGTELEGLGKKALILCIDELDKLNGLQ